MVSRTHALPRVWLTLTAKVSWPRGSALAIAVLVFLFCLSTPTSANTYVVSNSGDSGAGTLRQAIADANGNPGLDTIAFNIGGSGPFAIAPVTNLPSITDPVIIDGGSEVTFNPAACAVSPCIALDGSGVSSVDPTGLDIQSGNSTIKGLAIGNFGKFGINITSNNNVVQGDYLGTDVTGTLARPNLIGVQIIGSYTNNLIGGTTAVARNIVSGNSAYGIVITNLAHGNTVQGNYIGTKRDGMTSLGESTRGISILLGSHDNLIGGTTNTTPWGTCTGACNLVSGSFIGIFLADEYLEQQTENNIVQGNYIGTNVAGAAAVGNSEGIEVAAARNNLLGGPNPGEGNLISGNIKSPSGSRGININGTVSLGIPTYGNVIQGNRIGTTANGISALGNAGEGVLVWDGAFGNTVGGTTGTSAGGACTGACNLIAFNGTSGQQSVGVRVYQPQNVTGTTGNVISRNSIFSNLAGGIDLGLDGSTPDDIQDPDSGPNGLQNYPIITSVGPTVHGTLNSTPNRTFLIEFFTDPALSNQQGRVFRGSTSTATDVNGDTSFSVALSGLLSGHYLSATATDLTTNDTSEFSAPFHITTPSASNASVSGQITMADGGALGGITVRLNGSSSATTITNRYGSYSFGGLETGGFYTITPERSNYNFSPASRSFSVVGNQPEAGFVANADAVNTTNPLDTNLFFVRQQYLDFLGREPDPEGLAYWTSRIDQCGDGDCIRSRRIAVSAAFFIETEFQQTGFFVYRLYRGALGRTLSLSEFSAGRATVSGRLDLETAKLSLANSFVQRSEFRQKYESEATAAGFVNALLQAVTSSSGVDLSEHRSALISRYLGGKSLSESRSLALIAAIDYDAYKQAEYNRSFVLMEYFAYLQRDQDQDGYEFWLTILNNRQPGNYTGMVCSFLTSFEYQRRFSTVISHSNAECPGN